jgi:hypothetical protein
MIAVAIPIPYDFLMFPPVDVGNGIPRYPTADRLYQIGAEMTIAVSYQPSAFSYPYLGVLLTADS